MRFQFFASALLAMSQAVSIEFMELSGTSTEVSHVEVSSTINHIDGDQDTAASIMNYEETEDSVAATPAKKDDKKKTTKKASAKKTTAKKTTAKKSTDKKSKAKKVVSKVVEEADPINVSITGANNALKTVHAKQNQIKTGDTAAQEKAINDKLKKLKATAKQVTGKSHDLKPIAPVPGAGVETAVKAAAAKDTKATTKSIKVTDAMKVKDPKGYAKMRDEEAAKDKELL